MRIWEDNPQIHHLTWKQAWAPPGAQSQSHRDKWCIWESLGPSPCSEGTGSDRKAEAWAWPLGGPTVPQELPPPGPLTIAHQANERLSGPAHSPSIICSLPFPLILLPPQQFPKTWGLVFSGRPRPGLMKGAAFLQLANSPGGAGGGRLVCRALRG